MKCATEGCLKEGEPSPQGKEVLCGRCARLAPGSSQAKSANNTPLTAMDAFGSMVPGDLSPPPSANEPQEWSDSEKNMQPTKNLERQRSPADKKLTLATVKTKLQNGEIDIANLALTAKEQRAAAVWNTTETTRIEPPSSEPGTELSEQSDSPKSAPTEIALPQAAKSTAALLNAEEARLASLNLVDECIERLNWQMRRLTLRPEEPSAGDPLEHSYNERQRAGLAVKTASEIGKMVRLKIDAFKVFKKLEDK